MKVLKLTMNDLKSRSYLTGKKELWVDIGDVSNKHFEQYGHFGASLTFIYDTKTEEWILNAIAISDPKHHYCKAGERDFLNYILDTPFGTTNRFKYDGVINYSFEREEPYFLKDLMAYN